MMILNRKTITLLATLACFAPIATHHAAIADTTTFDSGTTWSVTDALNNPLGNAQYVAVNSEYPTLQPPGVTNYGAANLNPSWTADLSSIPGAYWIWAPGITGATPNASLTQFSFSKQFFLDGTPTSGTISVAVDDFASVSVNGSLVGSTGSITDAGTAFQAQSALTTFDIAPYLVSGQNTILIHAQNGPDSFAGATDPPYDVNTAGVVFGGSFTSRATAVPEPSPVALLALGLLPIGLIARRRIVCRA
jgi:hypothetical protein